MFKPLLRPQTAEPNLISLKDDKSFELPYGLSLSSIQE